MNRYLKIFLFFAGLVAVWALVVKARIWSPVLVPSPGRRRHLHLGSDPGRNPRRCDDRCSRCEGSSLATAAGL